MAQKEIWKDIPNYEGYYQASNLGRVRSMDRVVLTINDRKRHIKGVIMKGFVSYCYRRVVLKKDMTTKAFKFSQLVAMAFLEHIPNGNTIVVDHINGIRDDDRLKNLRLVTIRENSTNCFRSDKKSLSSKYVGVSWNSSASKWVSNIYHNGTPFYLGCFNSEEDASNAYQQALSKIKSNKQI